MTVFTLPAGFGKTPIPPNQPGNAGGRRLHEQTKVWHGVFKVKGVSVKSYVGVVIDSA